MMGEQQRTESLFYYFRLEDQPIDETTCARQSLAEKWCAMARAWRRGFRETSEKS